MGVSGNSQEGVKRGLKGGICPYPIMTATWAGVRELVFKGGCDACAWTLKMDPKQVFGLAQKDTLNNYF